MLEEVDQHRKDLCLSVETLATHVGVHRNTLFRVLNGQVDPRALEMNRVYLFLGASGVQLEKGVFRFLFFPNDPLRGMGAFTDAFMLREMGRVIRQRRINLDISQETLAEWAELHRNTIGKIERGEADLSLSSLFRIYRSLGVDQVFMQEGKLALR